jgi:hypothetical protein
LDNLFTTDLPSVCDNGTQFTPGTKVGKVRQPSGLGGFARSPSGDPKEMNAQVGSDRLGDEQSICREDKGNSPCTRGLQTNVIGAGNQKMVVQAE